MLIIGACSPKVRWVSKPTKPPVETPPPPQAAPPPAPVPQKVSFISLLLPFGLDHIGPGLSYSPNQLK
jgi:hypothetical protein